MPAVSQSQQRLMGAALGGASFPLAKKIRNQMTTKQMRDFASTTRKNLPNRIRPVRAQSNSAAARSFSRTPRTSIGALYSRRGSKL